MKDVFEVAVSEILGFVDVRTLSNVGASCRAGRQASHREFHCRFDRLKANGVVGESSSSHLDERQRVIQYDLAREKAIEMEWQDYLHLEQGCLEVIQCDRYPSLLWYFEELEGVDMSRSPFDCELFWFLICF